MKFYDNMGFFLPKHYFPKDQYPSYKMDLDILGLDCFEREKLLPYN